MSLQDCTSKAAQEGLEDVFGPRPLSTLLEQEGGTRGCVLAVAGSCIPEGGPFLSGGSKGVPPKVARERAWERLLSPRDGGVGGCRQGTQRPQVQDSRRGNSSPWPAPEAVLSSAQPASLLARPPADC